MSDEMDRAYQRDSADQRKFDELRRAIDAFLAEPPSRLHPRLAIELRSVSADLADASDHITAVWN